MVKFVIDFQAWIRSLEEAAKQRRYGEAIDIGEEILARGQNAISKEEQGHVRAIIAEQYLLQWNASRPRDRALLEKGRLHALWVEKNRASIDRSDAARSAAAAAGMFAAQKKIATALETIKTARSEFPESPQIANMQGVIYMTRRQAGDVERAINSFTAAESLAGSEEFMVALSWLNRAIAQKGLGQEEAAIQCAVWSEELFRNMKDDPLAIQFWRRAKNMIPHAIEDRFA